MTTTTELALPTDGDDATWTKQEHALVAAAGLYRTEGRDENKRQVLADRPTVEAFLAHCRRTGLDPIARQIYAIYRGGKWGIQISIDGARLVAERTGSYEGQTPVEWTDDGKTWTQVWLSGDAPRAARVGVYRRNFREPLFAVATWDSYAVMKDEWAGGQKTGNQVVSDMWKKFGPLMLGKCAEMLALRKAFPQDLSGLYSTEEMAQADKGVDATPDAPVPAQRPAVVAAVVEPDDRDWKAEIDSALNMPDLTKVGNEAQALGILDELIDGPGDEQEPIGKALFRRRAELTPQTLDVEVKASKGKPRAWVAEARPMKTRTEVAALSAEARASSVEESVLEELADIMASLPEEGKADGEVWATPDDDTPAVLEGGDAA